MDSDSLEFSHAVLNLFDSTAGLSTPTKYNLGLEETSPSLLASTSTVAW